MKFKKYHCQNGLAKPVNPYRNPFLPSPMCRDCADENGTCPNANGTFCDPDLAKVQYQDFEKWSKENTVSCSKDLIGEYEKELFYEPVEQGCSAMFGWINKAIVDSISWYFMDKRKFIQLKPVVKDQTAGMPIPNAPTFVNSGLSTNDDKCCGRCIKGLDTCTLDKEPEVKQQFGECQGMLNDIRDSMSQYWGFHNFKHMDQNSCFTINQIEILMQKAFELGQKSPLASK